MSLNTTQWVPIVVNNVTEAYGAQLMIAEGVAEVGHSNATALMTSIVYGFGERTGYGHSGRNDSTTIYAGTYAIA